MRAVESLAHIQLKSVLFATDFSCTAPRLCTPQREIVKQYGAKLFVSHLRPPVANPVSPSSWKGINQAAEFEEEQQRRKLLKMFAGI
jgi:hypothetical protein